VDAITPGIPECLDLFGLAGNMRGVAVLDIAAGGGPLEIAVEFDAIRRVKIDALHLAAQPFALGQGGHDLQTVAQNHPVLPMAFVPVKLGALGPFGQSVEIAEQKPLNARALTRLRSLPKNLEDNDFSADLIKAVQEGLATPLEDIPQPKNTIKRLSDEQMSAVDITLACLRFTPCG